MKDAVHKRNASTVNGKESSIVISVVLLQVIFAATVTTVISSSNVHGPLGSAAAVSTCADQQFGTNFHRICEAQTLWNSFNVGLRAGYLGVRTAGGASDGH